MAKKNDLLSFLFGESVEIEAAEGDRRELDIAENLERLFEVAAETELGELEAKKTPLAKALAEFGIKDAESDLQLDTEGFVLATDNHDRYVDAMTVLGSAEAMHKLAEMGWVVTKPGDPAMTNEPPDYRIRFLEITTVDTEDREPKAGTYDTGNREDVIKKAQKFATTPMDRDDELNPVENDDGKMGKKDTGVGKAKEGEDPEKAIHDALMSGDPDRIQEFTSTGSMGTAMSQGQPFVGMVKKSKPYGKGTKFKMPSQWTVKQPVVNKQVKRKATSESTDPAEQAAQKFLNEEDDSEADFAGQVDAGVEEFNEPEEGDILTEDHRHFYQYGKLWLEVPEDQEWEETARMIREKMQAENFLPNVWFISDHGNSHLMTDIWPKPEPGMTQMPGEDSPEVTAGWLDHIAGRDKPKGKVPPKANWGFSVSH